MGHLLSSVNPDAAAAIQPPDRAPPLPPIGSVVIYHMRQGHGRMGRTRFPAFVMDHGQGRQLALTVFIDAGDVFDEQLVSEYGIGREFHAWEPIEDGRAVAEAMRGTITSLHTRVGELEQALQALSDVVLGDFEPPKVSIIHIMQDFENRLRAASAPAGTKARGKGKR